MSADREAADRMGTNRTRTVVVSGTGTEIGKTVATAALTVLLASRGLRVGACKPVQTGLAPGETGDVDEVAARAGLAPADALELVRLPEPLAPETAARRAGAPQPTLDGLARPLRAWATGYDVVVVEGAGGVLVRLGTGLTVLDLARELHADVVVVTRAGLGTLSDTELAVRAVTDAGLRCAGTVVGALPAETDLATRCNLEDLPRLTGVPLLGAVPAGAGGLAVADFRAAAPGWFGPDALPDMRPAS